MYRCSLFIFLFILIGENYIIAEENWSLEKCIQYAMDNNIQIKQSVLNESISRNLLVQSKANLLPTLNGDVGYNINYGKTIDPTTNLFVNRQQQTSVLNLTTGLTLFNGLRKVNTIKRNQLDMLAKQYSTQDLENNIALNVSSAYLQILLNIEETESAIKRIELTAEQVAQSEKLVKAGAAPEGSLLDVLALLATDSASYILANNSVIIGKLNLALLLQLEDPFLFEIESPNLDVLQLNSLDNMSADEIFNEALLNQPRIKKTEYDKRVAEKDVKLSQGLHYPTLSFFYRFGTNHSSLISSKVIGETTISNPVIGFIEDLNGNTLPLAVRSFQNINVPILDNNTLWNQYSDNLNHVLGFSLRVPIFNGFSTRTSVKNSQIQLLNAEYAEQSVKDQLRNDVYVAHADAKAALQQYNASKRNVAALIRSFEYVEKKFNLGAANTLEYSTSRSNLTIAENRLLQSKYDYILKLKVLDFYLGRPITLN